MRRRSYKLPFVSAGVLLVVIVIILAVAGGTASSTSTSTTLSGDQLASGSDTTAPSSGETTTTEGDTSATDVQTSTTEDAATATSEDTATSETTSTSENTSPTESTSTTTPAGPAEGGGVYTCDMTGDEVVPAVTTSATAKATFTVDDTGTKMSFTLQVAGMTDVQGSRVHIGAAGSNGSGVVVLLAGRFGSGSYTGQVASGVFGDAQLIGPLNGKTIADFVALIKSGEAYITVGTVKNPGGEVRGQIE